MARFYVWAGTAGVPAVCLASFGTWRRARRLFDAIVNDLGRRCRVRPGYRPGMATVYGLDGKPGAFWINRGERETFGDVTLRDAAARLARSGWAVPDGTALASAIDKAAEEHGMAALVSEAVDLVGGYLTGAHEQLAEPPPREDRIASFCKFVASLIVGCDDPVARSGAGQLTGMFRGDAWTTAINLARILDPSGSTPPEYLYGRARTSIAPPHGSD